MWKELYSCLLNCEHIGVCTEMCFCGGISAKEMCNRILGFIRIEKIDQKRTCYARGIPIKWKMRAVLLKLRTV